MNPQKFTETAGDVARPLALRFLGPLAALLCLAAFLYGCAGKSGSDAAPPKAKKGPNMVCKNNDGAEMLGPLGQLIIASEEYCAELRAEAKANPKGHRTIKLSGYESTRLRVRGAIDKAVIDAYEERGKLSGRYEAGMYFYDWQVFLVGEADDNILRRVVAEIKKVPGVKAVHTRTFPRLSQSDKQAYEQRQRELNLAEAAYGLIGETVLSAGEDITFKAHGSHLVLMGQMNDRGRKEALLNRAKSLPAKGITDFIVVAPKGQPK